MIWRGVREDDLTACLGVAPARIGTELVGYDRAVEAWKIMMRSRSFQSAVIEADSPIAGHRIVAFGAAVFVSRAFADEELSNPRPGLNARIIASIDSGQSSIDSGQTVVLNHTQLRSANTEGGLDLVVLYGTWRKNILGVGQISEAQTLLALAFQHLYQGFRFNRLITESTDEVETKYAEQPGWRMVSDYREFYVGRPDINWNRHNTLAIVEAEDANRVPGTIYLLLFQYREPVLRLRQAEQDLLSAALTGLTDEELASRLHVRLSTVKKLWRSLFERASARPNLFPRMRDGLDGPVRGRQKRQFILNYVRDHPEELRPFEYESKPRSVAER
jgi:DNA-binding CsgD family transcriptional regulator